MKSILKPILLGSVFSAIGLCCTFSYASGELSNRNVPKNQLSVNYLYVLPTHTSEGMSIQKTSVFNNFLNKPFLTLSLPTSTAFSPLKIERKNNLFEMAVIFNDKLQLLLAKLSLKHVDRGNLNTIYDDIAEDKNSININSNCQSNNK